MRPSLSGIPFYKGLYMANENIKIPTQGVDIKANVNTWALPEGAIARFGEGTVSEMAFSPDRKYLVVGTYIGLWWYEVASMTPIALWETERGMISALDFSSNGKWLATGNMDGTIKILDIQCGTCVARIQRPIQRYESGWIEIGISKIMFSADNQHIAASCQGNGDIYLWDVETGELSDKLTPDPEIIEGRGRTHLPRPLCFSLDGHLLASASPADPEGTTDFISVWNLKNGKQIAALKGHTALVRALDFSPCGRFLASGDVYGILKEWDITTGNQVQVSSAYSEASQVTLASSPPVIPIYSPSGVLHAIEVSYTSITVWNVECKEKLNTFEHQENISRIHFSKSVQRDNKDFNLVLASKGISKINLWTLGNPEAVNTIPLDYDVSETVKFSLDGQTLISGGGSFTTFWDVAKKRPQRQMRRRGTMIHSINISPTGNIRALGNNRNVLNVWDVETNETITTVTKHQDIVTAATFSPTGEHWASGDAEGTLYVWDGNREPIPLCTHTDSIKSLSFSPDGNQLVSASRDKTAWVWDVASGQKIASLPLTQLDAELYLGDLSQKKRLMKIQRIRNERGVATRTPFNITSIAITFSPCGNIIAGGLPWEIRLWDARTYDICFARLLPRECERQSTLAFTPCGQYFASGSWWAGTDKVSIRLWDVANGENIATFLGHPTDVECLAFSPDGTILASGSFDGTILLWDMKPYLRNT